jgi:hypothetical protein
MIAMLRAGEIGIPAPIWAVKLVNKAINDYITSPDVKSLDVALGFKGKGTGKTRAAEAPQRLHKVMKERLCARVHKLVGKGLSKTEACRQVAGEVKALFNTSSSLWATNCYSIKPPNADTLLDYYEEWKKIQKKIEDIVSPASREKDIEDLAGTIDKLNSVLRCHLANPSQQLDTDTVSALKEFLESLQPKPTISPT